jgi:hypothetical protein
VRKTVRRITMRGGEANEEDEDRRGRVFTLTRDLSPVRAALFFTNLVDKLLL